MLLSTAAGTFAACARSAEIRLNQLIALLASSFCASADTIFRRSASFFWRDSIFSVSFQMASCSLSLGDLRSDVARREPG